jgi:hypothetical protein
LVPGSAGILPVFIQQEFIMNSRHGGAHRRESDTVTDDGPTHVETPPAPVPEASRERVPDHSEVTYRQRERFGGIKWGSAFFGWLTAIGTAVLLTALVAAAAAVFDLSWAGGPGQPNEAVGITGAIIAAVVLFVAYYCGGYVAGRMARFNGVKQGIAVLVWTVIMAVLALILVVITDAQLDLPDGLPRLPMDDGTVTAVGIVAAVIALAVSVVGAVLGGLASMRFHRTVDRTGYEAVRTDHDI